MKIAYKSEDGSYNVVLTYFVKRVNKYYPGIGKSSPKVTQCILEINGLIKTFATVTKHYLDEENQEYAYKQVTKKLLTKENIFYFNVREGLWDKLFEELENKKNESKNK